MVIVTNGQTLVGQQVEAQVQSTVQTGAGVLVFAEVKGENVGDAAAPRRETQPETK